MVRIKEVQYSSTGAVTLKMSDKSRLCLDYDSWMDLNLPKETALSSVQLDALNSCALYHQVREKALSLLAKREYAGKELKLRLMKLCKDSQMLDRCLNELQEKDLQSDSRYAHARVRFWLSSKAKGQYWMLGELQSKGITRDLANSILQEYEGDESWLECARKRLSRIQRTSKVKKTMVFRQKLYQQGFSANLIDQVLSEADSLTEFQQ